EAGDRECETLANSSTLPRLTFLSLGGYLHRPSSITADGGQALIGSPNLSRLKHLHLDNSGLGDAGADGLAKADWGGGRVLGAWWGTGVGAPGVRALIRPRLWPNLQYLVLSGNPFGDAGANELLAAHPPTRLGCLFVMHCDITEPLQQALRERFGKRTHF